MRIRVYSKQEFALMYFPGSKPHTAVNHLMRWICRCAPLREALEAAHYTPHNRCSIGICYEGGLDTKGKPKDMRT